MTDAPELKPCPFCGGGARIYQDPSHSTAWFCGCEDWDCFGNMMWDETKTGATDKWNRRADLSSPLGVVVKPLEWVVHMNGWLSAETIGGEFWVQKGLSTSECQKQHTARILAALKPPDRATLLAHAMRLPEVAICDLLREAAGDLTEYVDAEYPLRERALYPAIAKRHFRDMELVRRINAALEARHE